MGCGACCKLHKGSKFPTPDKVFADYQDHLQIGHSPAGWNKRFWMCSFGVPCNNFDREAGSACVDNMKMVDSPELGNFKCVIRAESNMHEASMNQVKLLEAHGNAILPFGI